MVVGAHAVVDVEQTVPGSGGVHHYIGRIDGGHCPGLATALQGRPVRFLLQSCIVYQYIYIHKNKHYKNRPYNILKFVIHNYTVQNICL